MILPPILGHFLKYGLEAGSAPPIGRREVGTGKDRLLFGSEKHRHGPAPLPLIQRQGRLHIDLVQIRPFLPIHFNADKLLVHDLGDPVVLEGLAFHHMTPVASGVADGEENRFVHRSGAVEGFLPPRIPVYRVVGMLEEVGTCLMNETVGWTVPGLLRHGHSPYHPLRLAVNGRVVVNPQGPAGESPFYCGKGSQAFCFVLGLKKSSPYFREYASGFFKPVALHLP